MSEENVEAFRRVVEAWNADDLVLGHVDLTARTTDIEFTEEFGSLMTFRGGGVITSQDFLSHAEALEAAGLSE